MPYTIRKRGSKYCVINKDTGKVKSCKFKTKTDAEKYRRFLEMYHQYEIGKGPKPKKAK